MKGMNGRINKGMHGRMKRMDEEMNGGLKGRISEGMSGRINGRDCQLCKRR